MSLTWKEGNITLITNDVVIGSPTLTAPSPQNMLLEEILENIVVDSLREEDNLIFVVIILGHIVVGHVVEVLAEGLEEI